MMLASEEQHLPEIPDGRERIEQLQKVMSKMPQATGMDTSHHFAGGAYVRRMFIPKDTIVVGKVHKTEHFIIGCAGELYVAGDGEPYILRPGDVRTSPPGTKRAVIALSDVVALNVHKAENMAPSELEKLLIEDDPDALFDADNKLKPDALETGKSSKINHQEAE